MGGGEGERGRRGAGEGCRGWSARRSREGFLRVPRLDSLGEVKFLTSSPIKGESAGLKLSRDIPEPSEAFVFSRRLSTRSSS